LTDPKPGTPSSQPDPPQDPSKKAPDPSRDPGARDPIVDWVEEFLRRLEEGEELDLDAFCSAVPTAIRRSVHERCHDILFIKQVLPGGARSLPADPSTPRQLGDFRLLREIGRGAMGVVYLARQISLERLVAVKVLPAHLSLLDRQIERFRREAVAAAKLQHPTIVPIHAVGHVDGTHFFAMEYIHGRSLHQELELLRKSRREARTPNADARLGSREGRSYPAQAAEICARLADALFFAHEHGIIHRDIKPQNVLIDRDGEPHLVDFGLAKDLDEESLSQSGDIAGTYFYMSPEQAMAKRVKLDHRTDIFSLGVVLYEMLTLRRPFQGKTSYEVLYQITFNDPAPIRNFNKQVPRDLQVICLKALEKNPDRRYRTAAEMAEDLRRFLGHESILARPPSLLELGRRKLVRHQVVSASTVAAVLALGGGFWWRASQVHGDTLRRDMAPILALAAKPDLSALEANDLREGLDRIEEVRREFKDLGSERAAMLSELEARIVTAARKWMEEGRALRLRGLPDTAAIPTKGLDQMQGTSTFDLERGLFLLGKAATVLPEDRELAELADLRVLMARIDVTTTTPGALVSVRPFLTAGCRPGEKVPLGQTPIQEMRLPPGYYRVIVEQPGVGFSESTRYLSDPSEKVSVLATILPTAQVTARGMTLIPAGEFTFGAVDAEPTVYRQRRERIEAFWIDTSEVSMAQYRRFLRATGRQDPSPWDKKYEASWDDLPAAGMTWSDAQAYAEWAGKRLPTHYEWQRAARGISAQPYPWGADKTGMERRVKRSSTGGRTLADFLAAVSPVASMPEGRSPDGLFHTFDNVREWTETLRWDTIAQRPMLNPTNRVILGAPWNETDPECDLSDVATVPIVGQSLEFGFRCAKSAAP
jgi:serine/threonine protein kinase/formylglycine-generating enzyme required for sulfatase activity